MLQSPYWQRFWRRRLSRRRLLGVGALGGAGLAAAALASCGGSAGGDRRTPTAQPTAVAADMPPPPTSRGGTLFLPGFEAFTSDTLDPHQTQFGPIYSSHSAVFSKILFYQDVREGVIAGDLAQAVPESVDGQEYVVQLRPGVHFQRPSAALGRAASAQERAVEGRELTADDVVFSFQRQMNANSPRRAYYFRSYQYEAIERIEAVEPHTVRIVAKEPSALMLHYLADTNAFIVPHEVVDQNDNMNSQEAMIGTGPFIWDQLLPLNRSRFVRNPEWFGWDEPQLGRPYIDAYESHFLADDAALEATFRGKKIDAALQVTNPTWVLKVRQEHPEVVGKDVGFSAWLNTRLLVDRPPFMDFRVRKAIHLAADRQQMIDSLFKGYGRIQGSISPVLERWALPEDELAALPGYRSGRSEREQDIKEARQLFQAAGSPALKVIFADQPSYVPGFASQFKRQLEEALDASVETEIRGYVQISEAVVRGDFAMTWQYDNGWLDPDDWLYPSFHSRGTKNSYRYQDAELDAMLEAQRREFDFQRRQQLVRDIQRYLLDKVLARLDYVTPTNLWVAWPYYRRFHPSPFFGESFRLADAWIDREDPSYKGREG